MTPEQIAKGLTKAQRAYMTVKAEPTVWAQERWMTFPPSNTHRVLMERGLVDRSGRITPLGLRLRAHLEKNDG